MKAVSRLAIVGLTLLLCWRNLDLEAGADAGPGDSAQTAVRVEALSRLKGLDLEANPSIKAVVLKLLEQVRGTPDFVEIVREFKLKDQEAGLLQIAAKDPTSQAGVDAMRLVLNGGNVDLLKQALTGTNALNLVVAMGHSGEKEMVPLLMPVLQDSARDINVRKQTIKSLAQVQEGAAQLLELANTHKLPEDLKLTATMELNAVRWDNLRDEAARLLPLPQGQDAKPLPPMVQLLKMTGQPGRGAEVFRRETVGCSKCHQIHGSGTDFGPNLSEIGTKLAKEAIYEAILDPSAGISFGFEAWQIELKDGEEAYGLIASETADELAVKAVGGVVTRYKKSDIVKRTQQKLSIMPAGLEKTMSLQDLVDLVEYLSSLKKVVK